jgi:hypothetical protein
MGDEMTTEVTEPPEQDNPGVAERLAALEAELGLRQWQREEAQRVFAEPPGAPRPATGWVGEWLRVEAERREIRHQAALEAERRNAEALEANATKIAKVEQRLAALSASRREEDERHARETARLAAEHRDLARKLGDLQAPVATLESMLATPSRVAALRKLAEQTLDAVKPLMR